MSEEVPANGISAEIAQIIGDEYEYRPEVKEEMQQWGNFFTSGFDYNICSILGPQSGGKSTLLNLLFHTKFPEMNQRSRKQTTKGLWLAYDDTKKTLVMDVEGTDSKERGEQHINFERKSALFSLAMSEVLIVNMWANDVGRYAASNYDTLKTVFDIHMKLFHTKDSPKTLLLFCLRDHQMTPIEDLSNTLRDDMHNIWNNEIQKPDHIKDAPIEDFFEFDFCSLPNFIYEKDKFMNEIAVMSKRFSDSSAEDYIFKPRYSKRIPADGLPEYGARIWEKIISNKDLDIPSMKEMLATVRCTELMNSALLTLEQECKKISDSLESGKIVDDFGSRLETISKAAIESYDETAILYFEPVYLNKRAILEQQINKTFETLKSAQSRNIISSEADKVEACLSDAVSDIFSAASSNMWDEISKEFNAVIKKSNEELDIYAKDMNVDAETNLKWKNSIQEKAVAFVEKKLKQNTSQLSTIMVKMFERLFKFNDDIPRDWDKDDNLPEIFKQSRDKALTLLSLFAKLNLTTETDNFEVDVLSTAQLSAVKRQFMTDIRPIYDECLQIQRRNMASGAVPAWIYLAMAILGFNEIYFILGVVFDPKNFLLLLLTTFVCGGIYALHYLNLLGPAEEVAKRMVEEVIVQGQTVIANVGDKARAASEAHRSQSTSSLSARQSRAEEVTETVKPKEE